MLLRHTTKAVASREALTINPAKTCQPVGAMYAALGIHGCLPHSHGSQGCCSYHRSALTRHYKEPVMAATSSFTEGSSVFGGQANLVQAIDTIFTVYDPEIIAVHTTCLSETIGDDVCQIVAKAREEGKVPEGKEVIYASTPSYVGSHVTGFANMSAAMAKLLAEPGERNGSYNVIPGWVEPADMREIKRLCGMMGIKTTVFPDTSGVLDAPMTGTHEFYPRGGVTVAELRKTGSATHTFALGPFASEAAAKQLDASCKVKYTLLDLPIGLAATDRFVKAIADRCGVPVPAQIEEERGQLLDIMADMNQYLFGRKVAVFGDPDQLAPLTEFMIQLDMLPRHIVSGTPGKRFAERIEKLFTDNGVERPNCQNGQRADMFLLHQWIKNEPVDLLLGNTYGKYIARDEDIPFVRLGFPILDRVGHSYFPIVGYRGAMRLLEQFLAAIMDRQDRDAPEESFELVM